MTVRSRGDAFFAAQKLTRYDYEYDVVRSENAGYPIYYTTQPGVNEWVSDLGNRLEVNRYDGNTYNIWIKPTLESAGFHKNSFGCWVM